jgi:hypothetical protein
MWQYPIKFNRPNTHGPACHTKSSTHNAHRLVKQRYQ